MEEVIEYNRIAVMKQNIIFMESQLSHLRNTRKMHDRELVDMIKGIKFHLASEYKKYFCEINCISVESLNDPSTRMGRVNVGKISLLMKTLEVFPSVIDEL